MELPLSKTRPRRESAADTAAAIARSLKEEAKTPRASDDEARAATPAPTSKVAGKRKAESVSGAKPKAPKKTASESFSVLKSGLPKSSKAALAKADEADLAAIRGADLKKVLNAHVKSLAQTVDSVRSSRPASLPHPPASAAPTRFSEGVLVCPCACVQDWHDSYEETAEEACEWFSKCGDAVEACLRVGVGHGVAFDQCHEVLKLVADTWDNISAIPFRGDVGEDVSNVDRTIEVDLGGEAMATHSLCSPEGLCSFAWPCLLARAAAETAMPDAALMRMVKDAVDHGVAAPHKASEEEEELEAGAVGPRLAAGRMRLARLFGERKAEWSALASTKKKHKMRRAIDRRFDGPKHMRTRDFGSDSDDDGYGGYSDDDGYGRWGGGYGYW